MNYDKNIDDARSKINVIDVFKTDATTSKSNLFKRIATLISP